MRLDVTDLCRRDACLPQSLSTSACCASPLGAVSPLLRPSWLTPEPRMSAITRSPSVSASVRRLSTTTPQPSART